MKRFKMGGVHPKENKLSAGKQIQEATLPKQAVIPLGQSLGAPSQPLVSVGDKLKVGQLIAKAGGFVSANIHSSVSGTVSQLATTIDASGYSVPAVYIDIVGDEWLETIDRTKEIIRECKLTSEEIIKTIIEAGIVGMGGATFPTHVKLSPPPGKKAEVLIINAVECEPYLTCDHQLMLEKPEEILIGVSILMKAAQVTKAYIGIENNKKDAIELLKQTAKTFSGIEIVPLRVQYPQGGEKQLIDAVIGRQIPSGALPVEVGAIVQNVATTFAVYEAVQKHKPLIDRIVTVTGMENDKVMDCIECGICSYTCPSNRPLLDYIRLGKTTVGKIIRNRQAKK